MSRCENCGSNYFYVYENSHGIECFAFEVCENCKTIGAKLKFRCKHRQLTWKTCSICSELRKLIGPADNQIR